MGPELFIGDGLADVDDVDIDTLIVADIDELAGLDGLADINIEL